MDYSTKSRLCLKRKPLSENAKALIAVIVLFAAYAFVGEMDYQDAISSSHQTCIYRRG